MLLKSSLGLVLNPQIYFHTFVNYIPARSAAYLRNHLRITLHFKSRLKLKLSSPLNPPILGDLNMVPPRIGGLGGQKLQFLNGFLTPKLTTNT